MTQKLTVSRLANLGALAIHESFYAYISEFREITCRAKLRFETRDWQGARDDAAQRLDLYKNVVDGIVARIRQLLGPRLEEKLVWASMKAVYSGLIAQCDQWELAETFFNSVTRRIFATVGVDPEIEFVDSDFDTPPTPARHPVYRVYGAQRSAAGLVRRILGDFDFRAAFAHLQDDSEAVAARLSARLGEEWAISRAEVISAVFYRGQAAYLVGRVFAGHRAAPLVLALLNGPQGILVDAVLLEENEVSILFSFAHSYFHVDAERPYDLVRYLKLIVPRKRLAELYISVGFNKQGKTELYRDLLNHLAQASERFEIAPGERGMVMAVFTMPGFEVVFKVIKDHFAHPKETTRSGVMAKYHLVYKHDRAGRLVDAQEFEHLSLGRDSFSDRLLDELQRSASRSIAVEGDRVIIRHAYVERRVVPLNLFISQSSRAAAQAAVIDYGRAIKDLMNVNIFPGDLLLKNFGVTNNGRIVFYDYDEVSLLTDCNFRVMPQERSYEEEIAAETWLAVGENDVFPAEFRHFLGLPPDLSGVFYQHHSDLFDAAYWRSIQARLRAGEYLRILPYEQSRRLVPDPESYPPATAWQAGSGKVKD